jgi:hypothetical protein
LKITPLPLRYAIPILVFLYGLVAWFVSIGLDLFGLYQASWPSSSGSSPVGSFPPPPPPAPGSAVLVLLLFALVIWYLLHRTYVPRGARLVPRFSRP